MGRNGSRPTFFSPHHPHAPYSKHHKTRQRSPKQTMIPLHRMAAPRLASASCSCSSVKLLARTRFHADRMVQLKRSCYSSLATQQQQQHHHHRANEPTDVTEEASSIPHFLRSSTKHPLLQKDLDQIKWENLMRHPVYNLEEITHIDQSHHDVHHLHERLALWAVKLMRKGFDGASGYKGPGGAMTKEDWIRRCLFLETVAGVPGMVGGMLRHLRSLRTMQRDYGWIHTLLEEAENERMHLMTFMNMKKPGIFFRAMVILTQGVFFNLFFVTYLISPKTCHRFVGYLEEEAVKTYTALLQDIRDGHLSEWSQQQAPLIARSYYQLPEDARVEDLIKCIRADEAHHRDVNHTFASMDQTTGVNPFLEQDGTKPTPSHGKTKEE